jgi:peptidoglycan/LPS O-acetylase OafA/YrhL
LIVASFIFFALTIVASMIAFHAIESPFIELGRWLSSPARGRVLTEVDVRASIEGSVE